jgi:hypothetical protein
LLKLLINEKLENKVKSNEEQQNGSWFKNLNGISKKRKIN